MSVVQWSRSDACREQDPLTIDGLDDATLLVVDGVGAADDDALAWCRRAPCVVVGIHDAGSEPSNEVDVALGAPSAATMLDALVDRCRSQPAAVRSLVDVLRVVDGLDVPAGLIVESLAYSMLLAGPAFDDWLRSQPIRPEKTFADPPLTMERSDDATVRITLARPANRNAFSAAMRDSMFEALTAVEVDRSIERAVIDCLGPVFSSGGDLTEFGSASDVVRAHQIRTLRSVGALIARSEDRIEVRMRGACVGAGVELSAFAGRVVAAPDTTVRLPEIGMGLIPGAGGTVSLTRRIGRQRTGLLALLGEAVAIDDPLVAGLADEIS